MSDRQRQLSLCKSISSASLAHPAGGRVALLAGDAALLRESPPPCSAMSATDKTGLTTSLVDMTLTKGGRMQSIKFKACAFSKLVLTRYHVGARRGDWLHPTEYRHGTRTTRRANARVPRFSVPAVAEKFEMTYAGLHQQLR